MAKEQTAQEKFDEAMASIEKDFGKNTIMRMSDKPMDVKTVSTGSLNLDIALGVGGLPLGRIVEIFGPESSGKSTLAMHAVAEFQKAGHICLYIDAENAMDPVYAKAIGVDVDSLYISQPETMEQSLEIVDRMTRTGAVGLIVVDSVAALLPRAELEGEMGDSHVGLHARLMSQNMRKIAGFANRSHTTVFFINQIRYKIGVLFGSPETTSGGQALKFYSSIRLDVRRTETIKDGGEAAGSRTKVKVIKNKVAPPFRIAEFDIEYGVGINRTGEVVDLATQYKILTKGGAWYAYNGKNIGQGRPNTIDFLNENPVLLKELEDSVRAIAFGKDSVNVDG